MSTDAEASITWSLDPSSGLPASAILISGRLENNGTPVYHRHFGGVGRLHDERIIVIYRRALGHVVKYPGEICAVLVDLDGGERTSEIVIVPHTEGVDHRDPNICVTPTGRIVCTYTDADSSGDTLASLRTTHSDDGGETWSRPLTFSQKFNARMYGAIKCVEFGSGPRLISPAYYFDTADGSRKRVGYFYSDDDGVAWKEGIPVWEGTDASELSEMEMDWLDEKVGFAAIRNSGVGIHWTTTADGGVTWSEPTLAPWSGPSDVAPSLDLIWRDGSPYVLLGYCDRAADETVWRWAKADDLRKSSSAMADVGIVTSTDMVGASGYQRTVVYKDGNLLFVEFKEYPSGGGITAAMGTDVRLVWASTDSWLSRG